MWEEETGPGTPGSILGPLALATWGREALRGAAASRPLSQACHLCLLASQRSCYCPHLTGVETEHGEASYSPRATQPVMGGQAQVARRLPPTGEGEAPASLADDDAASSTVALPFAPTPRGFRAPWKIRFPLCPCHGPPENPVNECRHPACLLGLVAAAPCVLLQPQVPSCCWQPKESRSLLLKLSFCSFVHVFIRSTTYHSFIILPAVCRPSAVPA